MHPRVAFLPIELSGRKPVAPELRREPRTWGEHLRRQRILRGLLQRDLAVVHGVTTETIYNWENGRAEPEVRYLPRIIDFLGFCPYTPGRPLDERLRVAREAQGLSRKRLAKLVCVDEGTLWRWEQGMRNPKGRFVVVAKAILNVVEFAATLDRGRIGRPLTAAEVVNVRRLGAEGFTLREIGRRLGVAPNTVRRYLRMQ